MALISINFLIFSSLLNQISKEDQLIISLNQKQLNLYNDDYFKDIVFTINAKKIKFKDLTESEQDFFKLSCHRKLELTYKNHYDNLSNSKDKSSQLASIRLHQDRISLANKHVKFAEDVFKKHSKVIPKSIVEYYMEALNKFHAHEKIIK